ncbi:MAG: signal recognition particle protein [Alphaproteobacteria bacterium]
MFEGLSNRLTGIFDRLTRRGALTEEHVSEAMREVRIALLEADVALPVVKDFVNRVKERAVGQEVIKSVTPGQMVIKIVNDCMVEMLGDTSEAFELKGAPPVPVLMVGLQGSGKTTSTGKIAKRLKERQNKRVLMASLDTRRPAAQEQLAILGGKIGVDTVEIVPGQQPVDITKRAMKQARNEGYDVIMLDTAGRLAIDEELMAEVEAVRDVAEPVETILVADALTGQDAVTVAKTFDDRVGVTGIMLTRVDGDSRGGAALSMRAVTGKPIKLLGIGEGMDAVEAFHPDRVASRILGMGDVVSLVEKAAATIDQAEAEELSARMMMGQFTFDDLKKQLNQITKMGGMGGIMKMLPGMGKMKKMMGDANIDDKVIRRQIAIIDSMTPAERANPKLMNAKRKKRIAAGSGNTLQDVNRLLKQHKQMSTMMKKMKKMGGNKAMMKKMQRMMDQNGGDMGGMGGLGGMGGPGGMLPPGFGK